MAKRILSMFLAVLMASALFVFPASAATESNGKNTCTILVTTKSNYWYPGSSSITLKQTKGEVSYSKMALKNWKYQEVGTGTAKYYGTWNITYKSLDGSDSGSKTLSGSSVTISLKPNKTYKITVSYNSTVDMTLLLKKPNSKWTTLPSWKVSGSWKLASYS